MNPSPLFLPSTHLHPLLCFLSPRSSQLSKSKSDTVKQNSKSNTVVAMEVHVPLQVLSEIAFVQCDRNLVFLYVF